MKALKGIQAQLQNHCSRSELLRIPVAWNSFGYDSTAAVATDPGEIEIKPLQFFSACIDHLVTQPHADKNLRAVRAMPPINQTNVIYGMQIRAATAWKPSGKSDIDQGTFLRGLCLIPYLKSLHVDVVYLLPIFETGVLYQKGELGSPYCVRDPFRLSPNLHDPHLGENSEELLALQFEAFVEACHLSGLRVIIDFTLRTSARDSAWILEHPEWFYWVKKSFADNFTPLCPLEPVPEESTHADIEKLVILCKGYKDYVDGFSPSPNRLNPNLWSEVVKRYHGDTSLLAIEDLFGITTLPAFSDVLGDKQAYWTDVTYLRFDLADESRSSTPFLTQAGVNVERPKQPNQELFDLISEIIPYYCRKFGIDGARIDMGHALPQQMQQMILNKTKQVNPNFSFWSEDFDHRKGQRARDRGEAFITGALWKIYRKVSSHDFSQRLPMFLNDSAVPILGALETPDTFRAGWLYPKLQKLEFVLFLNAFAPNVVPFINNGLEFGEMQPMNFGIDIPNGNEYFMPENHPLREKLPLFDRYTFNWTKAAESSLIPFLREIFGARASVCQTLGGEVLWPKLPGASENLLIFQYISQTTQETLTFIANRAEEKDLIVPLNKLAQAPSSNVIAQVGRTSVEKINDYQIIALGPLSGLLLRHHGESPE